MVLSIILVMLVMIAGFFIIYALLPTLVLRPFCFRGYRRQTAKGETAYCALTFDDGPNPVYTPRLLDLLQRYGVHATFFVVGTHAGRYPQLLKRMQRDAHQIATHHERHISNWFLSPRATADQCRQATQTVAAITGERPVYYRPPWGHLNLFFLRSTRDFRPVLWSAILGDWRSALGSQRLAKRIREHLHDGAIICLHDDGENPGANDDAPENTLKALEAVLPEAIKHYTFVTVDALYQISKQKA
ncbi:MAG: polysaccharide deacetylase family protein [Sporolactobacillus sp.]